MESGTVIIIFLVYFKLHVPFDMKKGPQERQVNEVIVNAQYLQHQGKKNDTLTVTHTEEEETKSTF